MPGRTICVACADVLAAPALPVMPDPRPVGFPPCWAVATYGGPARSALLAYKERGRADLLPALGAALAGAVLAGPVGTCRHPGPFVLVPVPSRTSAVRERGGDTTLELARSAAAVLRRAGVPARARPGLLLARATLDSAGLDAVSRAANLGGAMTGRERLLRTAGARRLVVVDDLVTTGATLTEAGRALAAAGHRPCAAAVIAATARRLRVGLGAAPD